ncbi:26S proteasome non-ATPase regulatory subunit 2 homolog A isoform X3 [Aegilops tauschii subsp. strangulata]|uniref:26S proteasome non-ATPase regulatory subunit 2 homolog A isoform X3 n=1 Tax=Aegilops tauschii subsp. strangulata TaxID=200361 RepID=UPI001E1C9E78|nr:26S proteasome non-ATPase regulatory subunit 2 homolog A isoform X2 [Aegilops tauschii subsp. strangulata]
MKGDDLSEEDRELKARLEDCVERAQSRDPRKRVEAIDTLRKEIRAATSSMTSVPKPLKFLRAHYGTLKACFQRMRDPAQKKHMADILSVLALTASAEGERESLKYCMMGSLVDICSWGHVYVRNLAFEIGKEWKDNGSSTPIESKIELVLEIVKFHMKHNAETEALDLLMEVGYLEMLFDEKYEEYLARLFCLVDSTNYKRACLYLTTSSKYLLTPDREAYEATLYIAFGMYGKFRDLASALRIVLLVNDDKCCDQSVKIVFAETEDFSLKQQLAFMIARYEIVNNTKLSEQYHMVAWDIGVMEPKSPEDIYKVHLIGSQGAKSSSLDSARQNLAATFVNAFVNAGYCQDKLMTAISDSSENLLFEKNELGKASAVASLGMIHLWDHDSGFAILDKYLQSDDTHVVAGALLGIGIVSCGVKNDYDPALALISGYSTSAASITRIGAILGLGIAYAGSRKDKLKSLFLITLSDSQAPLVDLVFSAISLGLVFVGSCNEEIAQSIISVLKNLIKAELAEPIIRLLPVSIGLLYLGKQEGPKANVVKVSETFDEIMKEVSKTFDKIMKDYWDVTLMSLAYAGTGNVLKVQELLSICSKKEGGSHQGPAVLGIALIAMAEELGVEMAVRSLEQLFKYGDYNIRRAVPLALGMLYISNPKVDVVDTLSRLSNDADGQVMMAATISLGLIGAGTNNARIAELLRKLSSQEHGVYLFCVRIAQGLVHLGKGLLTLAPYHSDRLLLSPVALAGLVTVLHACLNMQPTILGEYPYMLYILALAMQPRMLLTLDEDLKPLPVPVHVGQAVDVVSQAGSPRTITGFQTHNTPVLLAAGERAELATEKYIPLTPILEGFVILRKNPEHHED